MMYYTFKYHVIKLSLENLKSLFQDLENFRREINNHSFMEYSPGESFGMEFNLVQCELFRFIPISVLAPMQFIPNLFEKSFHSRLM